MLRQQEEEVVITRPSATSLLCIDSDDRYKTYQERRTNPSYPFTFTISKNESLLNGYFTRFGVTELRMFWTLPNISEVWGNHQITLTFGAGTFTYTLTTGFYTLEDIASTLQGLVRAGTSTPPGGVIADFTALPDADNNGSITFGSVTTPFFFVAPTSNVRTLFDMLSLIPTIIPANIVASGIVNLKSTDYIDIVCNQLTYNQDLKDSTTAPVVRDMVARVYLDESVISNPPRPVYTFNSPNTNPLGPYTSSASSLAQYQVTDYMNGPSPFMIYREYPYPKQIKWYNRQPIGNLTFEIYDDQGRSIQSLWSAVFPVTNPTGYAYANSFVWNMSLLISEN